MVDQGIDPGDSSAPDRFELRQQRGRGPHHLHIEEASGPPPGVDEAKDPADVRLWLVRQTLADPAGDHDWVIEATVDLDASDGVGEAVVLATALRRL